MELEHTVLVTAPSLDEAGLNTLQAAGCRVVFMPNGNSEKDLLAALDAQRVDGIIARGKVTATAIRAATHLRVISRHGSGYNSVDITEANARGIPVFVAAAANAQSVAEHAIGLLLSVARDAAVADRNIRNGAWERGRFGIELAGKTLGLVGFGAIGRKVANIASAIGMQTLVYDPYAKELSSKDGIEVLDSLDALLARSQVLSLHCPLTSESTGLLGARELALLPKGAIVINSARGALIDETALIEALKSAHLRGAGLDTVATEPMNDDNELRRLENVVLTPHIGAHTCEAVQNVSAIAAHNVVSVLTEGQLDVRLCVNREVLNNLHSG